MIRPAPSRVAASAALALSLLLPAASARAADAPAALPVDRGVGQRFPGEFQLVDALTGKAVGLRGFVGCKALVLVFAGTACPVGDLYMPRIAELVDRFEPRGVRFALVYSNASETTEAVAAHAREFGLTRVPVLRDPGNVVADLALAERTPEVVVIDGRLQRENLAMVRYRGAIDDQYVVGARKPAPTRNYLADALEALLADRPVEVAATAVEGCLIERAPAAPRGPAPRVRGPAAEVLATLEAEAPAVEVGEATYAGNVAAILQRRCQECHRSGQPGPFPLLTYDDARRRAAMIAEVVDQRRMPPWHADPRHGAFANDRSLSAAERAMLLAWVEQGAPLGDPAAIPPARSFADGWQIGTPDLVFEMPDEYIVPAQGVVGYQRFVVPTDFKEDVWVQAAEARPTDRSVVHHIIVYVMDPERKMDRRVDSHLCGYAPGDLPSIYPEGVAKKIPAGSTLLFEVHYTPIGTIRRDRSKVGLVLAKEPPKHRAHTFGIANSKFTLEPGKAHQEVASSLTVDKDIVLLSLMPHMHLRGESFSYKVTFPDGRSETLLSVPAYDFAWQSYYTLKEPLRLPKGARIDCLARFDNSEDNPYNPDPKARVRWGDQTFEEMMIGYIDYHDAATVDEQAKVAEAAPLTPKPADTRPTAVRALLRALAPRRSGGDR